jgi:hypothetical protein
LDVREPLAPASLIYAKTGLAPDAFPTAMRPYTQI